jgi:hypothetical protein
MSTGKIVLSGTKLDIRFDADVNGQWYRVHTMINQVYRGAEQVWQWQTVVRCPETQKVWQSSGTGKHETGAKSSANMFAMSVLEAPAQNR